MKDYLEKLGLTLADCEIDENDEIYINIEGSEVSIPDEYQTKENRALVYEAFQLTHDKRVAEAEDADRSNYVDQNED